jgi:hypothetical protein
LDEAALHGVEAPPGVFEAGVLSAATSLDDGLHASSELEAACSRVLLNPAAFRDSASLDKLVAREMGLAVDIAKVNVAGHEAGLGLSPG